MKVSGELTIPVAESMDVWRFVLVLDHALENGKFDSQMDAWIRKHKERFEKIHDAMGVLEEA